MNKTTERSTTHPITVNLEGLCAMLSCGKKTAREIAAEAGARVEREGRVLYSVKKVEVYIESIAR